MTGQIKKISSELTGPTLEGIMY